MYSPVIPSCQTLTVLFFHPAIHVQSCYSILPYPYNSPARHSLPAPTLPTCIWSPLSIRPIPSGGFVPARWWGCWTRPGRYTLLKYLIARRYSPLCGLTFSSYGGLWLSAKAFLVFGQSFLGLWPRPWLIVAVSIKSLTKRHLTVEMVPGSPICAYQEVHKGPRGTLRFKRYHKA